MSDAEPFTLHAFWRTSAVYRVRVALRLKNRSWRERFVDLEHGGQRHRDFLDINPMGAVPALGVDPALPPLTQSLAILEYLEKTIPDPPLLPANPHGRARVRALALAVAADTHPFIVPRVRAELRDEHGVDDERWRAWQTHWLTTGLTAIERRLATEPGTGVFCHGDTVTFADICLGSIDAVMRVFGIRVADVPTVDAIVGRCRALPAFAEADPFRQEGAPDAPPSGQS